MDRKDSPEPDAPPSAEEIAAAEALRDALGSSTSNDAADFARAVSLAHAPRPIEASEHRAIVERAIAQGEARRRSGRRRQMRAMFAMGGGLALAAGIAFVVAGAPIESRSSTPAASIEPLVRARSTQPLFREPFARSGGESARIDRIASARASDLRDNRFAAWGVR